MSKTDNDDLYVGLKDLDQAIDVLIAENERLKSINAELLAAVSESLVISMTRSDEDLKLSLELIEKTCRAAIERCKQ